jgi:hypothetical protein
MGRGPIRFSPGDPTFVKRSFCGHDERQSGAVGALAPFAGGESTLAGMAPSISEGRPRVQTAHDLEPALLPDPIGEIASGVLRSRG